jgi:hypothetical protein
MDQGTVGEDPQTRLSVDVKDPRTMAKSGCPDCLGRGIRTIIRLSDENPSGLPEICHCVISYLKSHPAVLLEFLKSQEQVH